MGHNPTSGNVTYRGDLSLLLTNRLVTLTGFVANRILPIIPVSQCKDYFYKVNPGPMMVAPDTNRARGAEYGEINFSTDQLTYACKSRGIRVKIPTEDIQEYNRLQLQAMGSYIALLQMMNATEKRICDTIFNQTTWAAGTPGTSLTGHDATNEWDDHTYAVPVDDVLYAKQALVANMGALALDGNICAAMSWRTAHHVMLCDQIRDKLGYKYKDGVPANAVWMAELLAQALGVDEVIISGGAYKSDGTDASPTVTNFVSDELCAVFRRATFDGGRGGDGIPSTEPVVCGLGCQFQWNEMSGSLYEVVDYNDPDTKSEKTRVDQYTDEKVLVTGANYVIGNLKS